MSLPLCTYLKVRAQSSDFLELHNHRAVLEHTLRKYTCVTVGDIIEINHAGQAYHLEILDVKPGGAASIVEADVQIDFDEPVGYKEYVERKRSKDVPVDGGAAAQLAATLARPVQLQKARQDSNDANAAPKFVPFAGSGKRIDGKPASSAAAATDGSAPTSAPAIAPVKSSPSSSSSSAAILPGTGLRLNAPASVATLQSGAQQPAGSAGLDSSGRPPVHKSIIGDKFSKTKVKASAFGGSSQKLT